MLNKFKLFVFSLLSVGVFTTIFAASAYWGPATLTDISVRNDYSPQYDIQVKVTFGSGSGDNLKSGHANTSQWMTIRDANFGSAGVNRVEAILLNALSNNNSIYIGYNNPASSGMGGDIVDIYIKR